MRFVKILIGLLAFAASVSAQTGSRPTTQPATPPPTADTGQGSIRGKVVLPGGNAVGQSVRVTLQSLRGTQDTIFTDNQGLFEIRNLSPGDYTLEVEGDKLRFDVSTEAVQVYRGAPSVVTIALKEKLAPGAAKPPGTVVSVGELGADVPAKARKEFQEASKLSKEGKAVEAAAHLRKAIDIYPAFMMAHNDLGAQLLQLGDLNGAEAEFRKASELDPKAFNPYLNLGIVLVRQKRFPEAAETLRKALTLESNSPAARLYLGLALMGQEDFDGAEKELKAAYELGGAQYAQALFHLGQLYMNKGERTLALRSFEDYLRMEPDAANAAQARKLIGMLR